jgi:hypothetical protein
MKVRFLVLLVGVVIGFVLIGCAGEEEGGGEEEQADAGSRPTEVVIEESDDVQSAVGPDGAWIILFESDVTVDDEVTVEGEVYEEEGADEPRRKIALYAQDSDRNVTDRYTLTVPELVIEHENTLIQGGTVEGDVYVAASGFTLTDATIDGDLIFESEELRDEFELGDESEVTGEIEVDGN